MGSRTSQTAALVGPAVHYPTLLPATSSASCSAPWMCRCRGQEPKPGQSEGSSGPQQDVPVEKCKKQYRLLPTAFHGLGNMGRVTPETFNPRSSRDQPIRTDSSLMPEQGPGPGSPLKVLDHGGIWGSQVRGQGNWGSGEHSGGTGTAALYQLVGTCFDVLTTWTAVLAANEPCLIQQD